MTDTLGMLNERLKNDVRSDLQFGEHNNLIDNDLFQKMIICLDGPVITHRKQKKRAEKNLRCCNRHQCSKIFLIMLIKMTLITNPRFMVFLRC